MEDLESALADTEVSMTPSRQRRQLRLGNDTEEGQDDPDDDDGPESTPQQDATVGFVFMFCLFVILLVPLDNL